MTYDLRRLRRKGLIRRLPRSQRYELTEDGRRLAVFFTKTYSRIVCPSLAELDPILPAEIAERTPLARALARIRASARRPYRRGRNQGLKSSLRPSTRPQWAPDLSRPGEPVKT